VNIEQKQAEIDDVKGWIEDLKTLNGSTEDFINARRHLELLEDDMEKIRAGSAARQPSSG
jgi:hypothetical protein